MDAWIIDAITIGVILLFAYIAGTHTGNRQCRQTSQTLAMVLVENERLRQQVIDLERRVIDLEVQLKHTTQEWAALSAEYDTLRATYGATSIAGG